MTRFVILVVGIEFVMTYLEQVSCLTLHTLFTWRCTSDHLRGDPDVVLSNGVSLHIFPGARGFSFSLHSVLHTLLLRGVPDHLRGDPGVVRYYILSILGGVPDHIRGDPGLVCTTYSLYLEVYV